jgi:phosphoserine phosphatase
MMEKIAFCFDLDGTVTDQEILPLISREAGLYEEINLLTKITLEGLIPFQNSFKLRVKLLSMVPIEKVVSIVNTVKINQDIRQFIQENSSDCYIVTGNLDVWVGKLIEENIGCNYYSSIAEVEDGNLIGIKKILDKSDAIKELRAKYSKIITIGDSMNDCPMFQNATIGISYGGTHKPVQSLVELSNYVVNDAKSLVRLLNNLKEYEIQ